MAQSCNPAIRGQGYTVYVCTVRLELGTQASYTLLYLMASYTLVLKAEWGRVFEIPPVLNKWNCVIVQVVRGIEYFWTKMLSRQKLPFQCLLEKYEGLHPACHKWWHSNCKCWVSHIAQNFIYCTVHLYNNQNIKRAAKQSINMFFFAILISFWPLRDDYCNPSPPIGIKDKKIKWTFLLTCSLLLLLSVSDPDPHGSALKRPPDPDLHGQMRIRIRPVPEGLEK